MTYYNELIEQIKGDATESDWFSGTPISTYEITDRLFFEELNRHYTDNIAEEEAEEVITKTRNIVMPLINNLLDIFESIHQSEITNERHNTGIGIYQPSIQKHCK